jgi:hypothetical protein
MGGERVYSQVNATHKWLAHSRDLSQADPFCKPFDAVSEELARAETAGAVAITRVRGERCGSCPAAELASFWSTTADGATVTFASGAGGADGIDGGGAGRSVVSVRAISFGTTGAAVRSVGSISIRVRSWSHAIIPATSPTPMAR